MITVRLGLQPSKQFRRGDTGKDPRVRPFPRGGWFLTTEGFDSLDIREHVDRLLAQVEPVASEMANLRNEGVTQDVFCYWSTYDGQGGLELDPTQMRRLAALELPISVDIYLLHGRDECGLGGNQFGDS
jgi:hypothetical protein